MIGIRLFFKDPYEKPMDVLKELVLYDDLPQSTKRAVVR